MGMMSPQQLGGKARKKAILKLGQPTVNAGGG